ncbi:uncharacterized protein [Arachis hypogaea]|uniref:uncharacterized protein isoform X2 n=1 Tax=Arachis hypogaea TaxID=3818 RepID=UPI003B222079
MAKLEAQLRMIVDSVSNFFSGKDQLPWCDPDIVALRRRNCSFYETIPCCDGSLCNQFMEDHNTATFPSKKQELLQAREKHKEEQVIALKQSMQSGMAQTMKEQAQLREEMAYQYKLGNFEAATAIQRRLDIASMNKYREKSFLIKEFGDSFMEHHLGDMNKQLRLKSEESLVELLQNLADIDITFQG